MSRSSLKNFSVRKTRRIFTMRQRRTRRRKAKLRLLPLLSVLDSLKARKFKRFSKIEKTTRLTNQNMCQRSSLISYLYIVIYLTLNILSILDII